MKNNAKISTKAPLARLDFLPNEILVRVFLKTFKGTPEEKAQSLKTFNGISKRFYHFVYLFCLDEINRHYTNTFPKDINLFKFYFELDAKFHKINKIMKIAPEKRSDEQKQQMNMALINAVNLNYEILVKDLIAAGADINCQDNYGHTPLNRAANKKNLTVIKMLLNEENININFSNPQSEIPTAFEETLVNESSIELLTLFLKHPDFVMPSHDGVHAFYTFLYYSGINENAPKIFQFLLENIREDISINNIPQVKEKFRENLFSTCAIARLNPQLMNNMINNSTFNEDDLFENFLNTTLKYIDDETQLLNLISSCNKVVNLLKEVTMPFFGSPVCIIEKLIEFAQKDNNLNKVAELTELQNCLQSSDKNVDEVIADWLKNRVNNKRSGGSNANFSIWHPIDDQTDYSTIQLIQEGYKGVSCSQFAKKSLVL